MRSPRDPNAPKQARGRLWWLGAVLFSEGQPLAVSGVIEPLPRAERMYSWNLTRADKAARARRPVYLRVDSAMPKENGDAAH